MPDKPKDDEAFLSRWSRMKRDGGGADIPAEPEGAAETEPPLDESLSDEELLEQLGLPDPASLKQGDDFRAFMAPRVPKRLQRIALRALWRSNPVLANLDGMLDYGEDFTRSKPIIDTIYRVGEGAAWKFRAEQQAMREAAEREAALAGQESDETSQASVQRETVGEDAPPPDEEALPSVEDQRNAADEPVDIALQSEMSVTDAGLEIAEVSRPRPMRFRFD